MTSDRRIGRTGYLPRSESFEQFLDELNGALEPVFGDPGPSAEAHVSAQITGLPRSGTTLLNQLLAQTGAVGYVSNVMAPYWRVPTVGARLQRHLAANGGTLTSDSLAGRTTEPLDPHEFGYFWRSALGHSGNSGRRDRTPWPVPRLQRVLDAVTVVFGRPVVYKNFLVLVHVSQLRRQLQRTRFVAVRRPAVDVAASLLALYERLGERAPATIGLHPDPDPAEVADTLPDRIARQVTWLDSLFVAGDFERSPDSLVLTYDELCAAPRAALARVLEFVGADPTGVGWDALPARLRASRPMDALPAADRHALDRALERCAR